MDCIRFPPGDGNPQLGDVCADQVGSEKYAAIFSFARTVEEQKVQASTVVAGTEVGEI